MPYSVWYELYDGDAKKYASLRKEIDSAKYIYTDGHTDRDELIAEIYHDLDMHVTDAKKYYPWVVTDERLLGAIADSISIKADALSRMYEGWTVVFYSEELLE